MYSSMQNEKTLCFPPLHLSFLLIFFACTLYLELLLPLPKLNQPINNKPNNLRQLANQMRPVGQLVKPYDQTSKLTLSYPSSPPFNGTQQTNKQKSDPNDDDDDDVCI